MMKKVYVYIFLLSCCLGHKSFANIYTVTNNNVNGTGSLNQAILDANSHTGKDSVYFNIPFGTVAARTISINSLFQLPVITSPIVIDGTSQPIGNPFGVSTAKIRLTADEYLASGLTISVDSCEIYGLYISHFGTGLKIQSGNFKVGAVNYGNIVNDCTDFCIKISSAISGSVIACMVGMDTSGIAVAAITAAGIYAEDSKKITIGGKQPGGHNFVSGNNAGIKLSNCKFIDIQGNYVGTDVSGMYPVPNATGILILSSSNNITIGGDSIKELNVVSGNLSQGIDAEMYSSSIEGNYIGTDVSGSFALSNGQEGIYLRDLSHDNTIGGTNPGAGNVIAYNGHEAIFFQNSIVKNIDIRGNRMFCNSQLAGTGGIVVNGGNQGLQPPTLVIVASNLITGNSIPGLTVDLYSADSCSTCEGADYLATVTPDANGIFSISIPVNGKVTATSNDTLGNTSEFSECKSVAENSCLISAFIMSSDQVCNGLPISFTDQSVPLPGSSVVSWKWDFGDGFTSIETNPTHTYTIAGTHTVQLIVKSSEGCIDTSQQVVTILDAVAAQIGSDTTGCIGSPVHFTDQSIPEGTSFVVSWNWDLGDGDVSFFNDFFHTYTQAGDDTVTLEVINSNGCTSNDTEVIHILNFPTAQFSVSAQTCTLDSLHFTDESTTDTGTVINQWHWDFGDGNTSTEQNPVYLYGAEGSYTVQLIIGNDAGCSDTTTQEIEVLSGPVASFTYLAAGLTVSFQNTSLSSSDYSVKWKFGDGNATTLENPIHTFDVAGSYLVCLIVFDNTCGINDTTCESIFVIVGINNIAGNSPIVISPNPASSQITLSNIPEGLDIKSIRIMNSIGEETQINEPNSYSGSSFSVPLKDLPDGIYLLKLQTNEGIILKKIVISQR